MTSGNLQRGTIPNYPDVSIQSAIEPSPWWIEDTSTCIRGRLIWAFLPHVDQNPLRVVPIGRAQADVHDEITIKIEPLRMRQRRPNIALPVAAMPEYPGEVRIIQRAKRRPALILGEGGTQLPASMTLNRPGWQVSTPLLVAPYYGGSQDGTRAGFPPAFLDRIRRCEFPQFIWERVPR